MPTTRSTFRVLHADRRRQNPNRARPVATAIALGGALFAVLALVATPTPAPAQTIDRNVERVVRPDGTVVYRGTGPRFGGGHEVSRDGRRVTGTGTRFGSGYEATRTGRTVHGTGSNFGSGWTLSNDGRTWLGTGGNFGRSCPRRPGVQPGVNC